MHTGDWGGYDAYQYVGSGSQNYELPAQNIPALNRWLEYERNELERRATYDRDRGEDYYSGVRSRSRDPVRRHQSDGRSRSRERDMVRSRGRPRDGRSRSRERDNVRIGSRRSDGRSRSRDRDSVRSGSRRSGGRSQSRERDNVRIGSRRSDGRSRSRDRDSVRSGSRRSDRRSRSRERNYVRSGSRHSDGRSRSREKDIVSRSRECDSPDSDGTSRSRDKDNDVKRSGRDPDITTKTIDQASHQVAKHIDSTLSNLPHMRSGSSSHSTHSSTLVSPPLAMKNSSPASGIKCIISV